MTESQERAGRFFVCLLGGMLLGLFRYGGPGFLWGIVFGTCVWFAIEFVWGMGPHVPEPKTQDSTVSSGFQVPGRMRVFGCPLNPPLAGPGGRMSYEPCPSQRQKKRLRTQE